MLRVSSTVGFLLILLVLGCSVTYADTVDFVITGTYASDVPNSPLSSPNSAFSLSFTLSQPPALSPTPLFCPPFLNCFEVAAPLSILFSGNTTTVLSSPIVFFLAIGGGLFDVRATVGGNQFLWSFSGPPAFSGSTSSPTLLGGSFAVFPADSGFMFNADFGGISGGTVDASVVSAIPEPGTLLLLGTGLLGIAGVRRRFLR